MLSNRVTRRTFIVGSAATIAVGRHATALAQEGDPHAPAPAPGAEGEGQAPVFCHSVASGDPLPNAVIIWTRVTPSPDAVPGSEVGDPTDVRWEVLADDDSNTIVASGDVRTSADQDHTVKVDVKGLQPDTRYRYRFHALGQTSREGRTRTAPAAGAANDHARIAVCCCSNYEAGFFRGYREMADRDDIDFVLHLGDYTYEYPTGGYPGPFKETVRTVEPPNRTVTLTDYRIRQGHYHLDPDLADMRASKPLISVWDDHEFADNNWRDGATGNSIQPGDDYQAMKAQAMQAYQEWMPIRDLPLQRTVRWGSLMDIIIPDLRSYRDKQLEMGAWDPAHSMLGDEQFGWFSNELKNSEATWRVIGNEVMFAPMTIPLTMDENIQAWLTDKLGLPPQGIPYNTDQWDGYQGERQRILDQLAEDGKGNTVFLTGDIHSSWANSLLARGNGGDTVATEFVTPSICAASAYDTIATNRAFAEPARQAVRAAERTLCQVDYWVKWVDLEHHGYLLVDFAPERALAEWRHVEHAQSPDTPFYTAFAFQTFPGRPGVYYL